MLDTLMGNPAIIGLATGKLKALFTDGGTTAIVLRLNPENDQPPLPGFDVLLYKEDIEIVDRAAYQFNENIRTTHPYAITAEENTEYETLKDMFRDKYKKQ